MPARSGIDSLSRPRAPDPLRTLFRLRFPDFHAAYEQNYAASFGRFRLPLISRAAAAFRLCGDCSQGIARIGCPECGFDRFRPFYCKSYLLCPSFAQKRTLLLGSTSAKPYCCACPRCGSRMSVIALILDPAQIRKITACLDRHGRGPPTEG